MRICLVFYDMQDFGGLEEYAITLAVGFRKLGHDVSVFSTLWIPSENQYMQRLRENRIPVIQLPKWLSLPVSDWDTKERILNRMMWVSSPVVYILGGLLYILRKKQNWNQSYLSARGWLHGQIQRFIGPDRRKSLSTFLLDIWNLIWRPDVLHVQGYTSNLLFVVDWAHNRKVPLVYEEHQTPDPQFTWWKDFNQTINKSSIVIAVSEKSAEGLKSVCGVTQPIIVRAPLLPDPFSNGRKREEKIRNSSAPLFVTTVARLYVTKGLTYMLDAISKVKAIYPDVQFKIYGDGPLRSELLSKADQLGLNGEEIFPGMFDHQDLDKILSQTDIFALSSILEGQPLAIVEAMSYGCPIASTNVGGIPELITEGQNGLLCEPGDSEGLAQNICRLIENPDLRQRLGQNARVTYEQGPYQPDAVCGNFIKIYQGVLDN